MAAMVLLSAGAPGASQDQQPPVFKSGVELVMVDAQVVDRKGVPITGLAADKFEVSIDGKRRKVVSVELIDAATGEPTGNASMDPVAVANRSKAITGPGNVYILAVDQGSFRATNAAAAIYAVREFLKQVHPNDHVGMFSFPQPGVRIDPTRDRQPVENAVMRIVGSSALKSNQRHRFSLSDAIDVAAQDQATKQRVIADNCTDPQDLTCSQSVETELVDTVSVLELQAATSLHGLREVVSATASLPGRKTLVVLSAGIPSGDRMGGRLYMRNDAQQAGKEAAAAGILLYTLQLTTRWLDAHSPDSPSTAQTVMRETGVYGKALEYFNGEAGGTMFEVNTGAETAIDRMMREMAAYYLLGVAVEEGDRDGRRHRIQVKVNQRGSNVRHRPSVVVPGGSD